jgi:hypothetical protein
VSGLRLKPVGDHQQSGQRGELLAMFRLRRDLERGQAPRWIAQLSSMARQALRRLEREIVASLTASRDSTAHALVVRAKLTRPRSPQGNDRCKTSVVGDG